MMAGRLQSRSPAHQEHEGFGRIPETGPGAGSGKSVLPVVKLSQGPMHHKRSDFQHDCGGRRILFISSLTLAQAG